MHELSLCQALLKQVETIAHQHQAQSVAQITLQIGPLSGVEAELLSQAFTLARMDTIAEQAELILQPLPIRIRCQTCQLESEAAVNQLTCPHCGDWHTQLLSGDELLLAQIELMTA
ncbi:MAG: hydrogenase maturation nickel metallochaperone HypA [Pseudomonadota bacterium]|nr:hydrogenase maturation nickel metallochaperone HypA [Pseudomonadota bacterium]